MPNLKYRRRYAKRRPRRRVSRRNYRTGGYTGQELKYKDFKLVDHTIDLGITTNDKMADPTAGVDCLSWAPIGTGATSRIGRQILVKSIHIEGIFFVENTTTTSGVGATKVTWWLVQDSQTNKLVPLSQNIIKTASTAVHAFRNLEFSDRFTILARGTSNLGNPSNAYNGVNQTASRQVKRFSVFKRLSMPVTFSDSTVGIADVIDNSLHFVIAGEKGGVAAVPKCTYNARMRYVG